MNSFAYNQIFTGKKFKKKKNFRRILSFSPEDGGEGREVSNEKWPIIAGNEAGAFQFSRAAAHRKCRANWAAGF